jgi:uncharacterized protein YyaL (SSP411 family)
MRRELFAAREKRTRPLRDEKVLTAWNGLMLAAFAEAGRVLNEPRYVGIAAKNADFLIGELIRNDRLNRVWKDGNSRINAYIEDHANLADGLLELFQTTGELKYFRSARMLADLMIEHFWDEEDGGFFFTSDDHEQLIVRNKDFYDNATPSGNSVAAEVLLKLARLSDQERYEHFAVSTLRLASAKAARYPQAFGRALSSIEFLLGGSREILITGPSGNELERVVDAAYLPDAVLAKMRDRGDESLPLFKGREGDKAKVYVCKNGVCERPVEDAESLPDILRAK